MKSFQFKIDGGFALTAKNERQAAKMRKAIEQNIKRSIRIAGGHMKQRQVFTAHHTRF